ncbi:MAG: hypothetical protein WDO70_01760 [Alphaproteobacteria bacterium]
MPNDVKSNLTPSVSGDSVAAVLASWSDQDEILRQSWLVGESPSHIAEKLGRSVAAIMTRAARLGLPRRFAPGRKPTGRRSFLPPSPPPLKQALPRPPAAPKDSAPDPSRTTVERICLMCMTKFPSLGVHNRICANCKDSNDYLAGSRLPDLDFPI